MIRGTTRLTGLLGYPVKHSFSPIMHNAAFQKLGLDYAYMALPCAPENLQTVVQALKAVGFAGCNATIPHKQALLEVADQLTPIAERMGSANTLYWEGEKLVATTTDPFGALENLRQHQIDLEGAYFGIIGNGGSARAIAFGILEEVPHAKICFLGRNPEKAKELAQEIYAKTGIEALCLGLNATSVAVPDILIHTTPVGMSPNVGESCLQKEWLKPSQIVYDIVYNPKKTQLLLDAQEIGCTCVGGLGMLVWQGAKSFELWTGHKAPVDVMFASIEGL